jgi:alkyl hydroperoxide reductase subunit D
MTALNDLLTVLPEAAKDIKLNMQAVLDGTTTLSSEQRWGVAVASAIAVQNVALRDAVRERARKTVDERVIDDAVAAASLMAMNNVYYRFRHMVQKPEYAQKPARLRMNRLARPATSRADFELMCLAVSAINGCESCVRSHERAVVEGGLTEDHVHDAIRIAATIRAAAVALDAATFDAQAASHSSTIQPRPTSL